MGEKIKTYEVDLTELRPDPANANQGSERGQYMLDTSVTETGLHRGVAVDANGYLVAGNKTHQAAIDAGFKRAIIVETDGDTLVVTKRRDFDLMDDDPNNKARKAAYFDNRSSEVSLAWDAEQLLADMQNGMDLSSMFRDDELDALLAGVQPKEGDGAGTGSAQASEVARATLAERFVIPPFSVLDARQGYWQERKRAWIALGIQSELGRGITNVGMAHPETTSTINFYSLKRPLEADLGHELSKDEAAELIAEQGQLRNARQANRARFNSNVVNTIDGDGLKIDADRRQSGERKQRMSNGKRRSATFGQDLMKGENPNFGAKD